MMQTQARDNVAAVLVKFSLPLIISGILQQLYNWADAFIVGHAVGESALAAVGATTSVSVFFTMAITGFTQGLSILAAQRFGSGDREGLRPILSTFLLVLLPLSILCAVFGVRASDCVLHMLHTPADILTFAADYLHIIFLGVPFLAVYNLYSALLRAMGDSRAPFYAVVVSSLANVALDLWFVAGLHWQVAGAAAATVLSQGAMALFLLVYTHRRYPLLRLSRKAPLLCREDFKKGLRFGLPPALQFCITVGGSVTLQGFMNGFGSHTVAAITTAYRVDAIMLLPIINLGSAISTMVAQSKGANEPEQARHFWRTGALMNIAVALFLMAVMLPFGGRLVALFGVGTEAIIIGRRFFRRIALFYVFFGLANSMRGTIEGTGRVVYSSAVSIAALLLRIALSYLLAAPFHNMAIAYAEGLQWCFMVLCFLPFFLRRDRWTQNS